MKRHHLTFVRFGVWMENDTFVSSLVGLLVFIGLQLRWYELQCLTKLRTSWYYYINYTIIQITFALGSSWAICSGFIPARDMNSSVLKGIWWMPWQLKAMKDVAGCDKPRWEVNTLWPADVRMGKPTSFEVSITEYIGYGGKPGEVKHLSTRRKRNQPRFR